MLNALVDRRLRRIYVVDEDGKLAGVVSMSDALRQLVDSGIKLLSAAARDSRSGLAAVTDEGPSGRFGF